MLSLRAWGFAVYNTPPASPHQLSFLQPSIHTFTHPQLFSASAVSSFPLYNLFSTGLVPASLISFLIEVFSLYITLIINQIHRYGIYILY